MCEKKTEQSSGSSSGRLSSELSREQYLTVRTKPDDHLKTVQSPNQEERNHSNQEQVHHKKNSKTHYKNFKWYSNNFIRIIYIFSVFWYLLFQKLWNFVLNTKLNLVYGQVLTSVSCVYCCKLYIIVTMLLQMNKRDVVKQKVLLHI